MQRKGGCYFTFKKKILNKKNHHGFCHFILLLRLVDPQFHNRLIKFKDNEIFGYPLKKIVLSDK